MSLNESPIDKNLIAKVHGELRAKLNKNSKYIRKTSTEFAPGTMQEFHDEYWVLKEQEEEPWIFITIGSLFHPYMHNQYSIQVISTVPPDVWGKDRFTKLKKTLMETTMDSTDRDPMLEQRVSKTTAEFSLSKPCHLRDPSLKSLKKEALSLYFDINNHVKDILEKKDTIIGKISSMLDEYKQFLQS